MKVEKTTVLTAITMPTAGIFLEGTSNIITGNRLTADDVGINFMGGAPLVCSLNVIAENNFTSCSSAILLYDSSNNTIYHNNFLDNAVNVEDTGLAFGATSVNVWDDGYPSGGNYWNFQTGREIGRTGISDTPYAINSQNKDRYPLMEPFDVSFLLNYMQEITSPKISLQSPLNQTYNRSNVSLAFSTSKPVSWTGFSLDGQQNVTLRGNYTLIDLSDGLHNITVYVNDTFGNMAASTARFDIAKSAPFPTQLVAAVSVASVVIAVACAGVIVYFRKRKH